jgi:putative redox protein
MDVKATRTANDLRITLTARQHEFTADAETSDGGTDTAPTPHEILAAALAACTSMTVQMYANRKQWPLTSCDVTVAMSVLGEKKDPNSKTLFDVKVRFKGELDLDQRERLLEIANRCPVHRELARPIVIHVSEVAAG